MRSRGASSEPCQSNWHLRRLPYIHSRLSEHVKYPKWRPLCYRVGLRNGAAVMSLGGSKGPVPSNLLILPLTFPGLGMLSILICFVVSQSVLPRLHEAVQSVMRILGTLWCLLMVGLCCGCYWVDIRSIGATIVLPLRIRRFRVRA